MFLLFTYRTPFRSTVRYTAAVGLAVGTGTERLGLVGLKIELEEQAQHRAGVEQGEDVDPAWVLTRPTEDRGHGTDIHKHELDLKGRLHIEY